MATPSDSPQEFCKVEIKQEAEETTITPDIGCLNWKDFGNGITSETIKAEGDPSLEVKIEIQEEIFGLHLAAGPSISTDIGFNCELCGKLLKSMKTFKKHLKTHSDARPCKCTVCGKGFKRQMI